MNLIIPSAFTPDMNGSNDLFRPVPTNAAVRLQDFSVYNRWGERVYQTINFAEGWDGTYKALPADVGVYYYTVTYAIGHKQYTEKGDVTLVR
jgi:gliding motility-associated-like protein